MARKRTGGTGGAAHANAAPAAGAHQLGVLSPSGAVTSAPPSPHGLVDVHAHVLPGVDDGPVDIAAAVELCRAMAAAGTATVVATSHVSDEFPNRGAGLSRARATLTAALADAGVALDVQPGAEVALEQAFALDDEELATLAYGGAAGGWLLLEAPLTPAAGDVEPLVRRVMARGHRVVIAHPERSPAFQRSPNSLVSLVADGALSAVTAGAVGGRFGRTAQRTAVRMLADGTVHALTSDAHDLAGRPPGLVAPLVPVLADVPGLADLVPWLTHDAPAAILRGEVPGVPPGVVEPPAPRPPRRWWRRRR